MVIQIQSCSRVACKAEYTARHPACVGCTESQKNADSGSSQTVYFFAPFTSRLPHSYSVLAPMQHGSNGFSNCELPAQDNVTNSK